MLTKETEADRFNEGKLEFSLVDFRMFQDMYKYFDDLETDASTIQTCMAEILNFVSVITATDNQNIHAEVIPRVQSLCYRLSLFDLGLDFHNSRIYNLLAFEPMVQVLTHGIQKYSRGNWRRGYVNKFSSADSLLRHLRQMIIGERLDQESGLPHTGHIMCNIMFLTNDLLYVNRD